MRRLAIIRKNGKKKGRGKKRKRGDDTPKRRERERGARSELRVYIGAWSSLAAFKKPVVRGEPTASERRRAIEETCDGEKARVGRADSYKDSGKGTFEPFHAVLLLAYSIYIYIYIHPHLVS